MSANAKNMPGAVIVSTGRCGSTLLSNLMREHEDVLSLSEFWPNRLNLPELFALAPVSGEEYWRLLSVPMAGDIFKIAMAAKMSQVPARTLHETNYMRRIALPSIVEDYDSLFHQVGDYVQGRPVSTPREHIEGMFTFIAGKLGKKAWVERTGACIEYMPMWKRMWPDMKFVHMYRDGRDVAQSMSKHQAFRLMVMRAEKNPESSWLHIRPLDAETLDLEQFFARKIPLPEFGRLWNRMIVEGTAQLQEIPASQQHWLRYDDLMDDPVPHLTKVLEFISPELDPGPWARRCAESMKEPRNDWRKLDSAVLAQLEEACAEGLEILGYKRALVQ